MPNVPTLRSEHASCGTATSAGSAGPVSSASSAGWLEMLLRATSYITAPRKLGRVNGVAPNVVAPPLAGLYGRLDTVQPEPPWHLAQPPSRNSCLPRAIAWVSASLEVCAGLIVFTKLLMSSQSL